MTLEPDKFTLLVYWEIVTDSGTKRITEKQLDMLMDAESHGARLIRFDDTVFNIAHIKEVSRKERRVYVNEFNHIDEKDKKFVIPFPQYNLLK